MRSLAGACWQQFRWGSADKEEGVGVGRFNHWAARLDVGTCLSLLSFRTISKEGVPMAPLQLNVPVISGIAVAMLTWSKLEVFIVVLLAEQLTKPI